MGLAATARRQTGAIAGIAAGTVLTIALVGGVYRWLDTPARGCEGESLTATVAASPDQFPVMSSLANRWSDTTPKVDGQCVHVTVVSAEPSAVAAALGPTWDAGRDGPRPDVWAPDSSAWMVVAAARPEAQALLPADTTRVAQSAIVLALPRPMAEAMGWPTRTVRTTDLMGALATGRTWAQFGHPEWGGMRFGMTDPTRSTAGLNTLLAVIDRDADGKVSNAELTGSVGFASAVTTVAPDANALVDRLSRGRTAEQALASAVAFPTDEQQLASHASSSSDLDLVPIYPGDEVMFADHPYAILNAPWVDSTKVEIATQFRDYLLSVDGQQAYGTAGFRDATGSTRHAPVLSPELGFQPDVRPSGRAPDAASVNQIIAQWSLLQRPVNVLVVLDTSGSMSERVAQVNLTRLQLLQQAAVKGIGLLNNVSTLSLWQFSSKLTPTADHRELVPFSPTADGDPAQRRQELVQAIGGLRAKGGTGLYDTTYAAFHAMQQAWRPDAINVVILISDGKNEDDIGLSRTELLRRLKSEKRTDRPAPFIGIAVGPAADAAVLKEISLATGGRTFVAKNDTDAVQQIVLAFAGRLK
jgi:Ca-activated chloride channel family protein